MMTVRRCSYDFSGFPWSAGCVCVWYGLIPINTGK